jgi:hypothetical protein
MTAISGLADQYHLLFVVLNICLHVVREEQLIYLFQKKTPKVPKQNRRKSF